MIVTMGTQRIMSIAKSLAWWDLAVQKHDKQEADAKAAIAPKRAPHSIDVPIDLPIVAPMTYLRLSRDIAQG
jgi:hypothetical protein